MSNYCVVFVCDIVITLGETFLTLAPEYYLKLALKRGKPVYIIYIFTFVPLCQFCGYNRHMNVQ